MKKRVVDTNVIIRFLTGDPPHLAKKAELAFRRAKPGELVIPRFILMEIVWVLLSFYQLSKRQVIEKLEAMLAFDKFELEREVLEEVLEVWRRNNISFIDAYLLVWAKRQGNQLFTFDKKVAKLWKNVGS